MRTVSRSSSSAVLRFALAMVCMAAWVFDPRGVAAQGRERASSLGSPGGAIRSTAPGSTASSVQTVPAPTEDLSNIAVPAPSAPAVYAPSYPATGQVIYNPNEYRPNGSMASRLRALDSDLQILAVRGGGGAVDGILAMVTGGVSITIGALIDDSLSPYLYVLGGASILRGGLSLAFITNPQGVAVTYTHMPMRDEDEVFARLRFGEESLAELAEKSRIARILDGSLNLAAGLAIVPVYLGPNNFEFRSPFDAFVMVGAAISVLSGVMSLFGSTEAERRWSAYEDLRRRLEPSERAGLNREGMGDEWVGETVGLEVQPSIGPSFLGVQGSF